MRISDWSSDVCSSDLATPETDAMIGADELAAMKSSATLINIARGSVVDQAALVAALDAKRIAADFLDVTTPETLPATDPLWSPDNAHVKTGRASCRERVWQDV